MTSTAGHYSLVVSNGTLVIPVWWQLRADVALSNGKVSAIGDDRAEKAY